MSFILDALRKSETERQRQAVPGLADAGYRPPMPRRAVWMPVLVVVLLANLALMAVLWLGKRAPESAPAGPVAVTAPPLPGAASRQERTLADAAGVPISSAPAAPTAVRTGNFTEILEPPVQPAPAVDNTGSDPASVAAPASGTAEHAALLPTAEQLLAAGALPLAPMHLDIHVFSANAAERFVFINTKKYTEGTALPEGPRVEEITAEGVVLSHDGNRFLLTRD